MNTSVGRVGLLAFLVVVSVSCADTNPPIPISPAQVTPPTPPTPPAPVPPPTNFLGAGTYQFVSSPSGRPVQPVHVKLALCPQR